MIAITSDFSKLYNYGQWQWGLWSWTEENETIRIHVVMHVSTFTHKSVSVKTHSPRGGVKGEKMGREARAKGLYIGPISSSEHAPYVAFSLKVTYSNVGRAKKCFACGGLSSVLGQISLKIGPGTLQFEGSFGGRRH